MELRPTESQLGEGLLINMGRVSLNMDKRRF